MSNPEIEEDNELAKLQPGGILHYDFRTNIAKTTKLSENLKVIQWNIERGVQFENIVQTLSAFKADIILLQELDINCKRSGYRNIPRELAKALQMQIYFICEFEEIDAVDRAPINAVGPLSSSSSFINNNNNNNTNNYKYNYTNNNSSENIIPTTQSQRHFHGNAILSLSATLQNPIVIPHTCGVNWEIFGNIIKEPRHGFRQVLRCTIHSNDRINIMNIPNIYLYCCHFEVFCGALMRVRQLLDVFRDASRLIQQEKEKEKYLKENNLKYKYQYQYITQKQSAFIIGGDFNTMADGIVRFAHNYANDRMRVLNIGEKESCWLQRKILSRNMFKITRGCCPFSYRFPYYIISILYERIFNNKYMLQLLYGFTEAEINVLDNNNKILCFYDPGDKALSITLNHPNYYGFVQGKLDWLLLSNFKVLSPNNNNNNNNILISETSVQKLKELNSISDETASYLLHQENNNNKKKKKPRDGYLLFNENYNASDHKGLFIYIQQHIGLPQSVYPEYGAVYTSSCVQIIYFTFTRILPWASLAFYLYYKKYIKK